MNTTSLPFDSGAEEQAALWAARLDGSALSDSDWAELEAWLGQNPSHRQALEQYCQLSGDLDAALPALARSGQVEMPAFARPRRRSWLALLSLGSALAGAAALGMVMWLAHRPAVETTEVATALARRQSITLVDGTRIDLNARTSLQVDVGRSARHVRLNEGEAFFAVSKDKSRPFTVDTSAGSVRVTGTAFDVRVEDESTLEVIVSEGSVQVTPKGASAPVTLSPGQKLTRTPEHVTVQVISEDALRDSLAWRQGQIVFDGVPLQSALARFARYHGVKIQVAPEVANLRLGGRYSLDDLPGFLAAIEQPLGVSIARDAQGAVLVTARDRR